MICPNCESDSIIHFRNSGAFECQNCGHNPDEVSLRLYEESKLYRLGKNETVTEFCKEMFTMFSSDDLDEIESYIKRHNT